MRLPLIGGVSQLVVEITGKVTGCNVLDVPDAGAGPAMNDAVAGHIDSRVSDVGVLLPLHAARRLRVVVGRIFADTRSVEFGQSVIVENRMGANGALGAQFVATSRPDGHTIRQISPAHVILPAVQRCFSMTSRRA